MTSRDEKYARVTELFQLIHRIRFSDILEHKEEEVGMSLPEFAICLCIDILKGEGHDRIFVSDLVKRLPSSPQAISKYLKQLDRRGFVRRLSVKEDRRITEIELTESGYEALEYSRERMNVFYHEIFGDVSEEEFNSMMKFLTKICNAMAEKSSEIVQELNNGA